MTDELRARADARLERALSDGGVRDPRPLYRPILRLLKERDPDAFERSVRWFEDELIPAVAGDADPLAAWLDYGRRLAHAAAPGTVVEVGPSGRSHPVEEGRPVRGLLLHLPDDPAIPAFVLRHPHPATRSQDATVELLAQRRVTASVYEGR